jgi:hypothetical protein
MQALACPLDSLERGLIDEIARGVGSLGGDPEARKLHKAILAVEKAISPDVDRLVLH